MTFEIELYKEKLLEYEAEFTKAIQQEYPLSHAKRSILIKKQQSLGILEQDIAEIHSRLSSGIKAYQRNLQEYKQVLNQLIENNYPLTEEIRYKLKKFQQNLKLRDEDVIKIESQIIREKQLNESLIQPKLNTNQFIKTTLPNLSLQTNLTDRPTLSPPTNLTDRPNRELLFSNSFINRRSYLKWVFFLLLGGLSSLLGKLLMNFSLLERTNQTFNNREKASSRVESPRRDSIDNKNRLLLTKKSFQIVTIDVRGRQISTAKKQAEYLIENIGKQIKLEMVYIDSGQFLMGSPSTEKYSKTSERPQHQVKIKAFLIGKYQVTQAQWRAIATLEQIEHYLDPNPSYFKGDDLPVEQVSWKDAVEFCQRLSQKTGHKYRLPSEAEWEYAARANTTTPFNFGDTITTQLANYNGNYRYIIRIPGIFRGRPISVGSFLPNAFGLYDMHGNVWEWCQDIWHNNYFGAPSDGTPWISNRNPDRVIRGGSWHSDARSCRSGYRESHHPGGLNTLGFRVVREI